MKKSRLDDLLKKDEPTNKELMEVLADLFLTTSQYCKKIIEENQALKEKLEELEAKVDVIDGNTESVIYTHVQEEEYMPSPPDDEESSDDDDDDEDSVEQSES